MPSKKLLAPFNDSPRRPLPRIIAGASAALESELLSIARARSARCAATREQLNRRWGPESIRGLARKLDSGTALRMWLWTSRYTTVLQQVCVGLRAAFTQLGHHCHLEIETEPGDVLDNACLVDSLANFQPDVVVLLDHVRSEYAPLFPPALPVISWIIDELPALQSERVIAGLTALDLSFFWSPKATKTAGALGYPHAEHLPMAASSHHYRRTLAGDPEASVGFATNLRFPAPAPDHPELYRRIHDRLSAMPQLLVRGAKLTKVLVGVCNELDIDPKRATDPVTLHQADMVSRHIDRVRIADAIVDAGFALTLYGHGWAQIPRFVDIARGPVPGGYELERMYQAHAVVLHINRNCNVHMRVFEAILSGAFVLARSNGPFDRLPGEINDYLKTGEELCVFEDEPDMIAHIRRALDDRDWRQGFIDAGWTKISCHHTLVQRAETMLKSLGVQLQVWSDECGKATG